MKTDEASDLLYTSTQALAVGPGYPPLHHVLSLDYHKRAWVEWTRVPARDAIGFLPNRSIRNVRFRNGAVDVRAPIFAIFQPDAAVRIRSTFACGPSLCLARPTWMVSLAKAGD